MDMLQKRVQRIKKNGHDRKTHPQHANHPKSPLRRRQALSQTEESAARENEGVAQRGFGLRNRGSTTLTKGHRRLMMSL